MNFILRSWILGTCKLNLLLTDFKSLTALKRGSQSFLLRKDRCVASLAPQVMQLLESHFTWARILPTILLHALWVETLRGTRRPTIAQVLNASEHVGRCQQAHQHHGSSVLSVTTHYVLSAAAVDFSWGFVIHHGSWCLSKKATLVQAFYDEKPGSNSTFTKAKWLSLQIPSWYKLHWHSSHTLYMTWENQGQRKMEYGKIWRCGMASSTHLPN